MLAELRQKAQITIPKEIIVKLGLSEGDKLDIFEKDGFICLMPVAVYPKKYLNELKEEINGVKARLASGEQPVFDSVDALFDKLEAACSSRHFCRQLPFVFLTILSNFPPFLCHQRFSLSLTAGQHLPALPVPCCG